MVDHRNLTAHTYNETLADEIFAAIPDYRRLLRDWVEHMAKDWDRLKEPGSI